MTKLVRRCHTCRRHAENETNETCAECIETATTDNPCPNHEEKRS